MSVCRTARRRRKQARNGDSHLVKRQRQRPKRSGEATAKIKAKRL